MKETLTIQINSEMKKALLAKTQARNEDINTVLGRLIQMYLSDLSFKEKAACFINLFTFFVIESRKPARMEGWKIGSDFFHPSILPSFQSKVIFGEI